MHKRLEIIDQLYELSRLEDNIWKSRAYFNASKTLSQVSNEDFDLIDDFRVFPGIGNGINDKIHEYLNTGKIEKVNELRELHKDNLDPELYKVRASYTTKRVPYELAYDMYKDIENELSSKGINLILAGSLRRKKHLIADIDVICEDKDYDSICSYLSENYTVLSSGDYKSSYLINDKYNIQLDLICTAKDELPFQLLYLTGSKEFNIKMRGIAKSKGYKLNQTGLYYYNVDTDCIDRFDNINSEIEIFDFLGMDYVEPQYR